MDHGSAASTAMSGPGATVSIVVRTYPGREGFLREALDSLRRQTYPHLEIVVVEDGGRSGQATVDAMAAESQHRFSYHSLTKIGRCATGNFGLAHAAGELLGFLDDDDRLLPEHVAVLVETLNRNPAAAAAYAQSREVPTIVHSANPLAYTERGVFPIARPPYSRAALAAHNLFPIQAVLFRRRLFETYGGFDERLDNLEDWDLWQRYAVAGDFIAVDRVTSIYRVPGNMRTALARQRTLDAYRIVFDRLRDERSPALTVRQRVQHRFNAAARWFAHLPPIFALRWHFRYRSARRQTQSDCSDQVISAVSRKAAS